MKLKSDLLQLAEIDTTNNINMNRVTIISNLLSNFNDITKKKSTLTEKSLVAKIEYSSIKKFFLNFFKFFFNFNFFF